MIHVYHLNGAQIVFEEYSNTLLVYLYDAEGSPIGMQYRMGNAAAGVFEEYWFEKNMQGDIVAVYDGEGTKLISYTYDAWGNFITNYHNGCTSSHHANLNPFRYRGYFYDSELEMYYLQSRYYDPAVGRFLNADIVFDYDAGFPGYNLFVYCGNEPILRIDCSGTDSTKGDDLDIADDQMENLEGGQGFFGGGSGGSWGGSSWASFMSTLRSAASGLSMVSGNRDFSYTERHHIFSDKNKTYTPQYREIMERYDMSLRSRENIVELPGHRGRHSIQYHKIMLSSLQELDIIADGDILAFHDGLQMIADFLKENWWIPYGK